KAHSKMECFGETEKDKHKEMATPITAVPTRKPSLLNQSFLRPKERSPENVSAHKVKLLRTIKLALVY
ncbi:8587_t:CDS:1, partial [Ambispora gerdemannii]